VLIRPWLRTAPLTAVAHLNTCRRSSSLLLDDAAVGSIDDDEVSVLQGGRVAARFREVEVEVDVDDGAPGELLDAVVGRLRAAGAGAPDPTPKLVRALGPRALAPPDLVVAESLGKGASAAEVLRAGIAVAVLRIVEHDRVIRADVEPEGIHQARVGTRRLRSDLRTFASLLDTSWSEPLRDELRWLAGELGEVRDRDVLGARLRRQAAALGDDDRVAADGVLVKLDRERGRAVTKAIAALDSRRYLALLDRLVDAANRPRTRPEAEVPAKEVLPGLAGDAFGKLRKGVKKLGKHPSDEALHELRIKAKKARYAADVAVPVVGDEAKAYTKAVGALQDVLGDHHDCSVAAEWLRSALPTATKAQAFVLGLLVAEQHRQADGLRTQWRAAWDDLDRPKLTGWLGG
jgi:CHAD domain-containing protein